MCQESVKVEGIKDQMCFKGEIHRRCGRGNSSQEQSKMLRRGLLEDMGKVFGRTKGLVRLKNYGSRMVH